MGVKGAWEVLRECSHVVSPYELAKEGYCRLDNRQTLRLGVDVSIWLISAQRAERTQLANGVMTVIFHKLCKLWNLGMSVVVVFDGPNRPTWKRGVRVGGASMAYERQVKQVVEAFGFEWHQAPGEAEAELAMLSANGLIDAVISDDSDALMFGTRKLIRNWGKDLSGTDAQKKHNKVSEGKTSSEWVTVYDMTQIEEKLGMTKAGLILMALMNGNDYLPAGLERCGPAVSAALAKAGFADELVLGYQHLSRDDFRPFLLDWRERVRAEVATNSRRFMNQRQPALASQISIHFPDMKVFDQLLNPLVSIPDDVELRWNKPMNVAKLVRFLTETLELTHLAIRKKFVTLVVPGWILYNLRCKILDFNKRKQNADESLPVASTSKLLEPTEDTSDALCVAIKRARSHPSTNNQPECRVLVNPEELFDLVELSLVVPDPNTGKLEARNAIGRLERDMNAAALGTQALRSDESDSEEDDSSRKKGKAKAKAAAEPGQPQLLWIADYLLRNTVPNLLEQYRNKEADKLDKKAKKTPPSSPSKTPKKSKAKAAVGSTSRESSSSSPGKRKRVPKAAAKDEDSDVEIVAPRTSKSSHPNKSSTGDARDLSTPEPPHKSPRKSRSHRSPVLRTAHDSDGSDASLPELAAKPPGASKTHIPPPKPKMLSFKSTKPAAALPPVARGKPAPKAKKPSAAPIEVSSGSE